jgi:hypothetical protein
MMQGCGMNPHGGQGMCGGHGKMDMSMCGHGMCSEHGKCSGHESGCMKEEMGSCCKGHGHDGMEKEIIIKASGDEKPEVKVEVEKPK